MKGITADGTEFRWDGSTPDKRISELTFSTRRGTGFSEAGCTLAGRRVDGDFWDQNLLDEFVIYSDSGDIAYEGRNVGMPRTSPLGVSVQAAGWMAHASDRKFREIFIDRDMSKWSGPPLTRQAALVAGSFSPYAGSLVLDPNLVAATNTQFGDTWTATSRPAAESWYDGQGVPLGKVYYEWVKGANVNQADANWLWRVVLVNPTGAAALALTPGDATANLSAVGPGSGTLAATTTDRTQAVLQQAYQAGPGGTAGLAYAIYWERVAAMGTHGLTLYPTGSGPGGLLASDVIVNLAARFCPKLNTSGVQTTAWPITHLVYLDPENPYDAFTDVNRFHLWNLSVWENKTLTFSPVDLSDYDWEIRVDDPGVKINLQGDTTNDFANGIAVTYTDLDTQTQKRLTPDTFSQLSDTNPENPANKHGYPVWTELALSDPTDQASALAIGAIALADFNRPKSAGTVTATGWVRDRQGHMQPAWKVRADDRVSITSSTSLSDRPRLVQETSYSQDGGGVLTASFDTNLPRLPAYLDRFSTDLAASNIMQVQA